MDIVDVLLEVLELGASDLHLTVGAPPVVRIDGVLEPLDHPHLGANDTRELIYSILSQDQRQRLENDWEMDFSYAVPGRARFRVNAYFQRNSLGAAFRLIPVQIPRLDDLGLPKTLHEFTRKARGFVVVTGPTGSGKSTTLAAMIDEINETRQQHIMTIETGISDSGVNLTQARFSRLQVPVPSLEVQAEIVAAVDRQLSVVEHLETDIEAKLERSSALREGILDLAFGGRLVPQDSTGESATELLERIGSDKKFGAERLRGRRKSPDSTDRSKRRGRVAPSANDLSE
jgi:hypothetical protein